jgi:hypothetical protein
MAQQIKPLEQIEMHGVYLAGNPANRPRGTASVCRDLRVMPGWWLRLRGGRKARYNLDTAQVYQIHQFRALSDYGADSQLIQIRYSAADVRWSWFSLLTYTPDPFAIESISVTYTTMAASGAAAVCNLPDRPVFFNGLGVRATDSKPPFSSYAGGVLRFFGLDAYCPSGNPTVAFAAGAGYNTVASKVQVWVGLHSISTDHYSNAVYCGEIAATGDTGTITVSNLDRLKYATHGGTETADLQYVFYATIDGGQVPYLLLNSSANGVLKAAVTSSTQSLSLVNGTTNGWVLDLTHAAPQANQPPRPMKSICYANGRLYGVLINAGSGSAVYQTFVGGYTGPDFAYPVSNVRELAGVVWSAAPGDMSRGGQLGDPWQCWPLTNAAPTPNGDQPIAVYPAPDGVRVLVFTARSVFVLTEAGDGLHEFDLVSDLHGLGRVETICSTPYGVMWVTQRRQIALFDGQSVKILSQAYQELLAGSPARCADYLLDPIHEIDNYRVYLENGTCVVHDFAVGGEAWTATGQQYTAARTLVDLAGVRHHVVAKTGLYTQEAQAETGEILTADQTFTTGQLYSSALPSGRYEWNWDNAGDPTLRKELDRVDVQGDGSAVEVLWKHDFVSDEYQAVRQNGDGKAPQSRTDCLWSYRLAAAARFWHKLVLVMAPAAGTAPTNHTRPSQQGDQATNFWGSVVGMLFHFGRTENRQ